MSCQEIMSAPALVLKRNENVGDAVKALLKAGLYNAPVVDDAGKPIGMFSLRQALSLALPKAVSMGGDIDLSFVSNSLADIKAKFSDTANNPIKKFMEELPPSVHPETQLMEGMLLLYRTRGFLPVVDKQNGKLVGIISSSGALASMVESV
jgi:CBS domain-containing protein